MQVHRSGLQAFSIYFCTRPPQLTFLKTVNIEKFSLYSVYLKYNERYLLDFFTLILNQRLSIILPVLKRNSREDRLHILSSNITKH